MSENRFVAEQVDVVNEDETEVWDIVFDTENTYAFMVRDTDTASGLCDLLNEQQARIKELEKENDDLRTTITKQVEAITEMKGIIYMLQGLRIEDYSSKIEENMVKLQKAYDGNLEDFLNYFKDGCFDE